MNTDTIIKLLQHAKPWNTLPETAWPELQQAVRLISVPRHQVVCHQMEQGKGVFFVVSGLVKLSKSASEGKDTVLFLAQTGDTIGEHILGSTGRYECRAQTLADSVLAEIGADWIVRAVQAFPEFGWAWCRFLFERLRESDDRVLRYRFNHSRQRLGLFLKEVARHHGRLLANGETELRLPLTHELIGEMTGVSRQRVTMILTQWATEGTIRSSRRRILLREPERL